MARTLVTRDIKRLVTGVVLLANMTALPKWFMGKKTALVPYGKPYLLGKKRVTLRHKTNPKKAPAFLPEPLLF